MVNNQDKTTDNGFKLEKFRFRREIERNWFSKRLVDEWNRLSNHIVSAQYSYSSFERRLGQFMDEHDRWN